MHRLKPNGEILLETGDTAGLTADQHPRPFLLPDHLSFASAEIISKQLKNAGFDIINVHKYPAVKLRFMKGLILKDVVKVFLPHKKSQLAGTISAVRANRFKTDMWIRARATS